MSGLPRTIAVRTDVVLDAMVSSLHERSLTLDDGSAPAAVAGHPLPAAARRGWFARAAELERFEVARGPMPWLVELVANRGAEAAARELAGREPLERPDPGHASSSSWRVPGPGGHVRHYLALHGAVPGPDERRLELKRAWMFGFYLRCAFEAAGDREAPA